MADEYNIEVEIYPEQGYMVITAPSGTYEYDIDSEKGVTILNKVFGTDVQTTVYSQNEQMTLEEYEGLD